MDVKSPQIFVINIYRPPDRPVKYTRKLTCLDHICTRHLNAQAGVVPIYYSYHDMTYISVDMQQLQ